MDDIFYLPESKLNVDSICTLFQKADVIQVEMLMYGKEASNRKQEIDRQHHTIPNKRTKDQKASIVEKSKLLDFSTNPNLGEIQTFCKKDYKSGFLLQKSLDFIFDDFSVSVRRSRPMSHCHLSIFW